MINQAIPYPPPYWNPEEETTIRKLSEYVARNGEAFEEKVRIKEADNPKFSFLNPKLNPSGHYFYLWVLFCYRNHLSSTDIENVENDHRNMLLKTAPGTIELIPTDVTQLANLLSENTGT
jgi:hypothetical protein